MHEGPRFNLKAVVQRTGLKADTIRAWERRYELPVPDRSGGGHRLYSQRDIDTIRWLMARQREGLSIKHAADLWHEIEGKGRDPLRTLIPIAAEVAALPTLQSLGGTIAQLREEWVAACLAYDERRAEQILAEAFAYYAPETVVMELVQKAISEIGDAWYRGDVTVQQEHFASALAIRRLDSLVMGAPVPTRPGRILAACPPDEEHAIGLLLLVVLLRRRGWEVVYLGTNVPVGQLELTVGQVKPQLVILAAQQLHSAASLLEMARLLQQQGVVVGFGGLIFNLLPALRQRIPGHFLGEQLGVALQVVEGLMIAPHPTTPAETTPEAYLRAREQFSERQRLIDAYIMQELVPKGISAKHLGIANRELGLNIRAALTLGDMGFLGADSAWAEGIMRNHGLPTEMLHAYLQAYFRIAREQLDEDCEPIITWLGTMLQGGDPAEL